MSSGITLSSATRQNLLSLQDTANLLSTTQNRLSTGKKVNSALDNPTNFFTSQNLSARSGDLSALLDGISNGVQTIQAANQGITSITKLLDTAKSTASQALADKTGGGGGVLGGSAAVAAKVTGTAPLASLGTTANGVTTFDLSNPAKDASLDISLDGGLTKTTIRLDSTTLASSASDLTKVTSDQIISAINGQISGSSNLAGKLTAAASPDGRITFSTTATGSAAQVQVSGSANAGINIGFGASTARTAATVTASAALSANTDFTNNATTSLTVGDGAKSVVVTLNKDSATDTLGGTLGTSATPAAIRDAINKQLKDNGSSASVSLSGGATGSLVFTSTDLGPDAQLSVVAGTNTAGGATGIGFNTFTATANTISAAPAASTTPTAGTIAATTAPTATTTAVTGATVAGPFTLGQGQQTTFDVGGQKVTINADTLKSDGTKLTSSFNQAALLDALNEQLDAGVTATAPGGVLTFTGTASPVVTTSGAGNSDQIGLFGTPAKTQLGATLGPSFDLSSGQSASFQVNGGTAITLSAASTDASNVAIGTNPNQKQVLEAINKQLATTNPGVSAYVDGTNHLTFVGVNTATAAPTFSSTTDTIGLGFGTRATAAGAGSAAPIVDLSGGKSSQFTVGDGTNTAAVTINALSLDANNVAIGENATQAKIAEAINQKLRATGTGTGTGAGAGVAADGTTPAAVNAKVSFVGNKLTVSSNAVGVGAAAVLTASKDTAGLGLGVTASVNGTSVAGTATGVAAPVTSSGTDATDGSSTALVAGTTTLSATTALGGVAATNASFSIKLGAGNAKTINVNTAANTTITAATLVKTINDQIEADTGLSGKVKASFTNGKLQISTTAAGADQKLAIQASGTDNIGFGTSSSALITSTGTDVGGSKGSSSVRENLAKQFNTLLSQITQQAKDSSYNGVNLLYRTSSNVADNTLHIAFNEKNSSALDIQGVKFDAEGLGLNEVSGNFQTDAEINSVIEKLTTATSNLRTQSSTFGSNLSVVQNRQDFSKNLINILDIGSANLVNADLNEEAANSQALSTRNSIATSALSLANQAQQGILQLLR
ncbi:flagellin [Methylobacterium sp. J-078]|uniref:flagellin N-terminal helical domain-containing protein n=1 Tax=Methylobacterium sp. J-078 TaxID=2836657 RepID=UPI0024413DCB|nr:flagellin [Methylobacterium sp. J-078]